MKFGLKIRLLGTFEIWRQGSLLTGFESAKVRALFAYLVLESDRLHTRDYLATLLWPEEPGQARHSLRQALSNLRRVLGGKGYVEQYLEIARTYVRFRPDAPVWVDVTAFLQGADSPHSPPPAASVEQALRLYQGDLLQGFTISASAEFDNWLSNRREHLHRLATRGLQALATYYEEEGNYARAEWFARHLIALEPWNEAGHRRLMRLQAMQGERSAALAQYRQCRVILRKELSVGPSRETQALYEAIREDRLFPKRPPKPNQARRLATTSPVRFGFVGREKELVHIAQRLADPTCRLLTITGMGGIGKSTLAREVVRLHAQDFQHGAVFVPMQAIDSPTRIPQAIARALKLPASETQSVSNQVLSYLAEKEMLLVLDNFEHLLDGTSFVLEILQRAPWVKIITTSREPLHLYQEWLLPLMGLSYPATDETAEPTQYDAVRWFIQSAKRVQPAFTLTPPILSAVIRICRHVQGSPLGIELATSWLSTMSCSDIAEAIERDLDFLRSPLQDMPYRHSSMRVVIDHSWARLSEEERRVFRRLSVFQGSFTIEAASAVAEARLSLLATLVGRSLVSIQQPGWYVLHPVLRQYAQEKLQRQPEEQEWAEAQHAHYMLHFLQEKLPELLGRKLQQALEEIDLYLTDIRTAWGWAVAHARVELLDVALESLHHYYEVRGSWNEACDLLRETTNKLGKTIEETGTPQGLSFLARVWASLTWFELRLFNLDKAIDAIKRAESILQIHTTPEDRAFFQTVKGTLQKERGNYQEAVALLRDSLSIYRRLHHSYYIAQTLLLLANTLETAGENAHTILPLFEEGLAIYRQLDNSRGIAHALYNVGNCAYYMGHYAQAQSAYEESLQTMQTLGNRLSSAIILNNLGSLSYIKNDYPQARDFLLHSAKAYREMGAHIGWAFAILNLGQVAEAEGKHEEALHNYLLALSTFRSFKHRWGTALSLGYTGHAYVLLGTWTRARETLLEALDLAFNLHSIPLTLRVLWAAGHYLLAARQVEHGIVLLAHILAHPVADHKIKTQVNQIIGSPPVPIPPTTLTRLYRESQNEDLNDLTARAYTWVLASRVRAA